MGSETEVLLTVEEVAKELETQPIYVLRLIALGNLKAARLGAAGKWRITRDDLNAFIQAGAPGFDAPKIAADGWFIDSWEYGALTLTQAVQRTAESEGQIPDVPLDSWDLAGRGRGGVTVELRATSGISGLFAQAAQGDPGRKTFKSWGIQYAANRLRADVLKAVERSKGSLLKPRAARLYASPDDFAAFLATGKAAFFAGAMLFQKTYSIAVPGGAVPVTVMFRLGHDRAFSNWTTDNAVAVAF